MNRKIWENPQSIKELDEAQCPLWFWNDLLETEELLRQLQMKSEVGVKCTNPHARTNFGNGFIGGYLDDEWFGHIKTVLDYKKEHDETMWLYDEIDWPAGTCGQSITKDEINREQFITIESYKIKAGETFKAQLSRWPHSDKNNVYIVNERTNKTYDLLKYCSTHIFGPELKFIDTEDAVAYVVNLNIKPYSMGGNEEVNYLDPHVTEKFLKSTYDLYYERFGEDFGSIIKAVFNDETRMCHAIPWFDGFAESFRERYGYDILDCVYMLILDTEEAKRVRMHYFDTVAECYRQNYFGVLQKWCHEHNIKLFAHLLGEESIYGHARYSGDYLRQYKNIDIAGADHLGKGIGSLNIKFTSAAAHSYGLSRSAVEVFAGCGWDMTYEEYIRMITWMFQMGMQIIINHGFFYSDRGERKNDWPPSQFFQWKGYDRMKEANAMTRRLSYALTDGVNECDVLVYHPIESFWYDYIPDNLYTHAFMSGPIHKNKRAEAIDIDEQIILNSLLCNNIDFDLLHNDVIDNFTVENGAIINNASKQQFKVLVLPYCKVLPLAVTKLVKDFVVAGGRVILIEETPEVGMTHDEDAPVADIWDELIKCPSVVSLKADAIDSIISEISESIPHPVEIVKGRKGYINNHMSYDNYLIDPYIHTGEDIDGIFYNRYLCDGERRTLFMNYGTKEEDITVKVKSENVPVIWDSYDGTVSEPTVERMEDGYYYIKLSLPVTHGIFIVSEEG